MAMRRAERTLAIGVVGVLILAAAVGVALLRRGGLHAAIVNRQPTPLRNVVLTWTGGSRRVARLEPGEFLLVPVRPTSETSLQLTWVNAAGKTVTGSAGAYIEPGYKGRVTIEVMAGDRLVVNNKVKPYPAY